MGEKLALAEPRELCRLIGSGSSLGSGSGSGSSATASSSSSSSSVISGRAGER